MLNFCLFVFVAGWVSPVHWGLTASCEAILLHMVQPTGTETQVLQEAWETYASWRRTQGQGRITGQC